jgi:hypothetical protein
MPGRGRARDERGADQRGECDDETCHRSSLSSTSTTRPGALLEAAMTEASIGYLDLRGLDATGVKELVTAIAEERDAFVRAGATAFHNPSFHPAFVTRVGDLLSMLERDARVCGTA